MSFSYLEMKHMQTAREQCGYCSEREIRAFFGMKIPDQLVDVSQQILIEQVRLPCRGRIMQAMFGVIGKIVAFSRKIAH